jgi:nitrile hydratase accessory protein
LRAPDLLRNSEGLSDLPRLPRDEDGPVFAEPWQAQAFALAVRLSEQGHFTWKEWAASLAAELQAAASRGEPDDGSRYYEHWLTALERLVTAKGLTDQDALLTRREAWAEAYRATPHGMPVELAPRKADARWLLLGVASTFAGYWLIHQINLAPLAEWTAWTSGAGAATFGWPSGPTAIPQVGLVASAALGGLLGLQHAFEPDHLAAVATLMTGERTSAKAAWLGACWGLGHTLTLLAAGTALVVLRAEMPAPATVVFELGVVLMLVGFGARAIYQAACNAVPRRAHSHARRATSRSFDADRWTLARPLLVGALHGLAGSGALTALVVATLPTTTTRLGYLALFGVGSTVAMVALSGLLGWQIARMGSDRAVVRMFSLAVGCVSTVLGLFWGYPIISRLL